MKNLIYVTFLSIVAFSCNPNQEAMEAFEANTKTMDILFESFANESVDYSKFADDVVFKGTLVGAEDSISLDEIKMIHKDLFAAHDVRYVAPMKYLTGVNPDTGVTDGSVRMYYDLEVTRTATDSTEAKSIIVPIYESFDFNDEGKVTYVQWYCDWTASLESLK
ncbi:MAG: hypothetical protein L7S44_00580 [Flavobacteriaceae bacterium]|nr:hypothetical protein [Flavobacteriaceae bacterium]